ncbi:MAG: hypothetical protein PQJ59_05935 [Spirochaetales bacterium]|nr:hypothetical protein [Spirochaetales bacterium]
MKEKIIKQLNVTYRIFLIHSIALLVTALFEIHSNYSALDKTITLKSLVLLLSAGIFMGLRFLVLSFKKKEYKVLPLVRLSALLTLLIFLASIYTGRKSPVFVQGLLLTSFVCFEIRYFKYKQSL